MNSIIKDKEWLINKEQVCLSPKIVLGKGQFGKVYLGQWKKINVAVKFFNNLEESQIKLIKNEFEAMTKLHHPHIIQLIGYTHFPFTIIMEYCEFGSLANYIQTHRYVSHRQKCLFMMDILKGLMYLHGRKPSCVIHRDIKPTNFLLTKHLQVKIADFGICKILRKYSSSNLDISHNELNTTNATTRVGTLYYMAPELLMSSLPTTNYSTMIDIYSFGCVVYEIFEEKKVFGHCTHIEELKWHVLKFKVPRFYRTPKKVQNIIIHCLFHDPIKRPCALTLWNEFDLLLKKQWWLKYMFF